MPKARTVKELAAAIDRSPSATDRLSHKPWFPPRGEDGSWDVDAVKRAIAAKEGTTVAGAPAPVLEEEDRKLLEKLESSTDPVELAKAATQLAARRLAHEVTAGEAGRSAEELKRSLEEWRRTEAAAIELGKERGFLIERDHAKRAIGACVERSHRMIHRFKANLAPKVEEWIQAEAFRALTADERARAVRAWADQLERTVRDQAVDEIEELIRKAIADELV